MEFMNAILDKSFSGMWNGGTNFWINFINHHDCSYVALKKIPENTKVREIIRLIIYERRQHMVKWVDGNHKLSSERRTDFILFDFTWEQHRPFKHSGWKCFPAKWLLLRQNDQILTFWFIFKIFIGQSINTASLVHKI